MSKTITDKEKIQEVLNRGVVEIIESQHLQKRMEKGECLRIKLGIDPTGPKLSLGRSVTLLKLRDFQKLGHQIVFIVGDFTGQVGDTSDKDSERPMLSKEEVEKNMRAYTTQAGKILNMKKVEVRYNSEWLAKLNFAKIVGLADQFSVHEFTAREVIARRLEAGKRVNMREMLYPLMQGYDSVAIKADVELGGTDQRFNLLAGRTLQKDDGQNPQDIIMTTLIDGTDGEKMSTSKGNAIFITDEPKLMYGMIMSIRDELIIPYFTVLTRVDMKVVKKYEKELRKGRNPKKIKELLAQEIVGFYHSVKDAQKAADDFTKVFSKAGVPTDIEEVVIVEQKNVIDLLVELKMAASKSAAKRLVAQGAVKIDNKKIENETALIVPKSGMIINVGKKQWRRLISK